MAHHHRSQEHSHIPGVVIIGGGFGGLYAAQNLGDTSVDVTLIDRRNFHLFQPLLYQVATGGLSPGDIASPLRAVLRRYQNIRVTKGEVSDIDPLRQTVLVGVREYPYDILILASGSRHHYFGNEQWESWAPGLKTVEDALGMRRRILQAFEYAENEGDPEVVKQLLTFVVVGGGATGVELAGALAELARSTLQYDFRHIDPTRARIILVEGGPRLLPTYPEALSKKAARSLKKLGVIIQTNTLVKDIREGVVITGKGEQTEEVASKTILWAAGVKTSPLARICAERTGVALDETGRLRVKPDLTLPGYDNIFVIGDLAHFAYQLNKPLPGVAPVAMQQGRYVARLIKRRLSGKKTPPFHYIDKGSLAVIGRNAAVADFGYLKFSGWIAWVIWIFVHIAYLVEFDNRMLVLFQWAYNYFTRKRGARLITEEIPGDDAPNFKTPPGKSSAKEASVIESTPGKI